MSKMRVRERKTKKRGVSPIIATILLVAITVVLAAVLYVLVSGYMTGSSSAPKTYSMSQTGSGTLATTAAYSWALATCVNASPCNTYNFSVSASSGLTTANFGIKILGTNGGVIGNNWEAIIWSVGGSQPEAQWNSTTGSSTGWVCLSGLTCPVGGLQDTGLLIITHPAQKLAGTGDTLSVYGLGSASVSGQAVF